METGEDIYVLVDPVGDQIYPVTSRAFENVSVPVAQVLSRNCVALFLSVSGRVSRLENMRLKDPSLLVCFGLWFGRPAAVEAQFLDVPADLEDIRTMILDSITYSRRRGRGGKVWWYLTEEETKVRAEVNAATSLSDLHARLRLPRGEDCVGLL